MKKREIRKFIVMIMGIILLVSEVQLFSGDNVYASTKTSRYEQLYVPSYAAMSGKMLYYAVGSGAQGGRLYMYNTSTKRQKKISDLRCTDLTITKKNIYCTVNKYIGSDARNRYVYRMSKDGKKTKVLAEGYSPVVVGKYIYYIGVKKGSAPWNLAGCFSAGPYPLPFWVSTWISTAPLTLLASSMTLIRPSISCPSTGPK